VTALHRASLAEIEERAARELSGEAYAYFSSGARDEHTMRRNVEAWREWEFRGRVLVDVSTTHTRVPWLGTPAAAFGIAPMAAQRLAHPDGELATARAAAAAGCVMVVSTSTNTPLEELTAVPGLTAWFQLYLFPDRAHSATIVRRAAAAGASALVLTVDVPVDVVTLRRPRGPLAFSDGFPMHGGATPAVDSTVTWDDLPWLRDVSPLPLVLKGITHPDDAARAVEAGCAAVVVSNHGGRQLDGTAPTADLLPDVVAAVGGRIPVYVDGGVRRGGDVLRALALGAAGVLVGRPVLWGLAVGGERGVARVLEVLGSELAADAALAGVTDLRDVPRDLVRRRA